MVKYTCNIPMHHYLYMNQAYKEEIKRIEASGGQIKAEVQLTFEAGDPSCAFSEFFSLVQKCSLESGSFTVPLKQLNAEELNDTLRIVQRPENKVLLTLSSEEMTVCGPQQSQDAIRASLKAAKKTSVNSCTFAGQTTSQIKSLPVSRPYDVCKSGEDQLEMDTQTLWEVLMEVDSAEDPAEITQNMPSSYGMSVREHSVGGGRAEILPGARLKDVQEQTVEQRSSSSSEAGSTPPDRKCPFTIPVGHFWYLNQIYKKEIEQILTQNGVTMKADVRVTFEGTQEGEEQAVAKFTDLVQKGSGEAASSLFHHKDVKQEGWHDIPKFLEESKKLLFTVSSEEILVWGPRRDLDLTEKSWKVSQKTINTREKSPEKSVFKPQNTPPSIIMHINDPLLNDGLTMKQSQWKLMNHQMQVSEIEKKYGVTFKTSENDQDKVKVKPFYKGSGGNNSMESHASRALLKLYQRIFTSVLKFTQRLGDENSLKSRSSADGSEQGEKGTTLNGQSTSTVEGATAGDSKDETCAICSSADGSEQGATTRAPTDDH